MALLKYREYDPYVLRFLNEQTEPIHKKYIWEGVAKSTNPSEEDLQLTKESTGYSSFKDKVDWSLVYLKQAELIDNTDRGVYQISDFGREFLKENPDFDFKIMKQKTPFLSNRKTKSDELLDTNEESEEQESLLDFENALDNHFETIKFSLLDKLKNLAPKNYDKGNQFEKICLELLLKAMNFHSGIIIGGAGDRGVDLILYTDVLKLNSIGVQCKCYQSSISGKDINHLEGGLRDHGLDKGIFITTSDFTKDAKTAVKNINSRSGSSITTINGIQLAELMMEFEIGIKKTVHYSYDITINE